MARLFFSAQRIRAGAGVPDRGGAWAGGCAGAMRAVRRADAALQAHGGSMAIAFDALDGLCGTCERRRDQRGDVAETAPARRPDTRCELRAPMCASCSREAMHVPRRVSTIAPTTASKITSELRTDDREGRFLVVSDPLVVDAERASSGRRTGPEPVDRKKNFPGVHSALGTAGASDARRGRVRTQACFIRRDIGDDA